VKDLLTDRYCPFIENSS